MSAEPVTCEPGQFAKALTRRWNCMVDCSGVYVSVLRSRTCCENVMVAASNVRVSNTEGYHIHTTL